MSDNYDYSYELGKDELMTYYSKSFKETESIINENIGFFESIENVNEIIVLGHSLSVVDEPYFKKILGSVKRSAAWTVSYHSIDQRYTNPEKLNCIGVDRKYLKQPIKLNELV